jgi:SAM-dependent methyltransferase
MAVERFEAFYREGTPPWDTGRPQPAIVRLANAGEIRGKVLDVGCGTGENALFLAGRGLDVTGVDLSPTAVMRAVEKATERGLHATFREGDACDPAALGGPYDTIVDSGVFHVFDDPGRVRYVSALARALKPGGVYHMIVFSDRQPGDWGPRRVTESEIRRAFGPDWGIERLEAARFEVLMATDDGHAEAWLASIRRKG